MAEPAGWAARRGRRGGLSGALLLGGWGALLAVGCGGLADRGGDDILSADTDVSLVDTLAQADAGAQDGAARSDTGDAETGVGDAAPETIPPADADIDASADASADSDASADTTPPEDEFARLVARYDRLSTVAGKGEVRDKGKNNWSPAFEGGPATAAELSRPHMAMGDAAGHIYIADKDGHAIRRVAPDGTITTVAGTGAPGDDGDTPGPASQRRLNAPNGLWVKADGTVYILDLNNDKVRKRDPAGTLTTVFTVPQGISTGRGLWVADDESLVYVASGTRVLRWRPTAGVEVFSQGFSSLGNLVVDPNGQLVVTDRGGHRVYRLDASGARAPIAGNGTTAGGGDGALALDTGLAGVRGVWFLDTGGYLLATHKGSQVWYVDSDGRIHLFVDGRDDHSHSGDGQFFHSPGYKISEARGISVDPAGRILITENDYGYVRMIERRGR